MGFDEPTEVQRGVIPLVLQGRDVLASAQTGTGKTASFVLPVLDSLPTSEHSTIPRVLVLTPTRELALQIADVCETTGTYTGQRTLVVVGGRSIVRQQEALRKGCNVLVATPGRLLDLTAQGACDLSGVQVLVLDEADRMLDMGFLPDVRKIVESTSARTQTLLFSATLSKDVLEGVEGFVRNPARVEVAAAGAPAATVAQYVLFVSAEAKKRTLIELLRNEGPKRVLVFARGRHRADHLSRILCKKGFSSASMHGGRTQAQRMRTLARFAQGEVDVLVATDVLARGIDVDDVAYVVNVDVPADAKDYVHRIGRTGRAGAVGRSYTLCSDEERASMRRIERLMGEELTPYNMS